MTKDLLSVIAILFLWFFLEYFLPQNYFGAGKPFETVMFSIPFFLLLMSPFVYRIFKRLKSK